LSGLGNPVAKSALLFWVSVPTGKRCIEVVLDGAAAGPVPSKQVAAVPYPTRSSKPAPQVPVNEMVEFTRAIVPDVADSKIVPITSGAGRFAVPPVPAAS